MGKLLEYVSWPVVIAVAQFVAGAVLRPMLEKAQQQGKLTGWVNAANYVVGLVGFALVPKAANAAGLLEPVMGGSSIFLAALAQNIAVTGIHSTFKNTVRPALLFLLQALMPARKPEA